MSHVLTEGGAVTRAVTCALFAVAASYPACAWGDQVVPLVWLASPPILTASLTDPAPTTSVFSPRYDMRRTTLAISADDIPIGLFYALATLVGATSPQRGDGPLLLPLLGPWLDFEDRGNCGRAGSTSCDAERGDKMGLVVDGVFRGGGVLSALGRLTGRMYGPTFDVPARALTIDFAPVQYAHGGAGLVALGSY